MAILTIAEQIARDKKSVRNKKYWDKYYEKNKEKLKEKRKEYYEKNKEKCKELSKKWVDTHREKWNWYANEFYHKNKHKYLTRGKSLEDIDWEIDRLYNKIDLLLKAQEWKINDLGKEKPSTTSDEKQ